MDPGGPKTYGSDGSGFGSGFATLLLGNSNVVLSGILKSMLSCMFAGEAVQGHQAEGEEQGGGPELPQKENGDYRGAPEPGTYLPRSVMCVTRVVYFTLTRRFSTVPY